MEEEVIKLEHADSVDRLLQTLQEQSEAGNMRGVLVAFIDKDGFINLHWAAIPSVSRVVGALEMLKYEILSRG